ncbi:hypothetical protein Dip510_001504 [Elusimicrobium posterum]|uniref:hypothetical protein n=1 Tax=Elusimicrobium posterum TaxID=3116653 RepID=UPI003C7764DA
MKKITSIIIVLIIAGAAVWGWNYHKKKQANAPRDIMLENIEDYIAQRRSFEPDYAFISSSNQDDALYLAQSIQESGARIKLEQAIGYPRSLKTEDLYDATLPIVRRILDAENKFYASNKRYTSYLPDLDMAFKNTREQYYLDKYSRVYLNNGFMYVLAHNLLGIYYIDTDTTNELYHLDFLFNGDVKCISKHRNSDDNCIKLGGKNPRSLDRMPQWVEYELPKNFLASKGY